MTRPHPRHSLVRKVAGFALLVLGVLGLVLPILQGGLFLAMGLFVLRDQYGWARRRTDWVRGRWPGLMERAETVEHRMIGWGRRQGARLRRFLPTG